MKNSKLAEFNAHKLQAITLPALVIMLGMQMMRVFFPSLGWYLRDVVGVPPTGLAIYAIGAFLIAFLAAAVRRAFSPITALRLTVVGVCLLRVAEQISVDPGIDLWISAAGTAAFLLFLPIFLSHVRALRGTWAGPLWSYGLILGLALDSAIKGLSGTLDLSWIAGFPPLLGVVVAAAFTVWLVWQEISPAKGAPSEAGWADAVPLLAIGPYFTLQTIIFQNHGWIAEVAGLPQTLAFLVLTLGNLFAVLGFSWGMARPNTYQVAPGLGAAATLGLATYLAGQSGAFIAVIVVGSQCVFGWAWGLLATVFARPARPGAVQSTIMISSGMLTFLFLSFLYFLTLDIALPFGRVDILLMAAVLFGLGCLYAARRAAFVARTPRREGTGVYAAGALFLAPLVALTGVSQPVVSEPPGELRVRVMTYNIHSAYGAHGRQDPEAIARVIETSGADIVGLQEISRGWLINGSTDLVSWLSRRLGMPILFQGTTDPIWGNAILSKYPILEYGQESLPGEGTLIGRGYLWARIDAGGPHDLLIIDTHLHQITTESEPRQRQVSAILEFWDGAGYTVLLGDMNALPGSEEMELIAKAGFIDAWSQVGEGDGNTYSSLQAVERIDWIWYTPDLKAQTAEVPVSTASDHLPVLVTLE